VNGGIGAVKQFGVLACWVAGVPGSWLEVPAAG
jgi:hypothetical protein